MRSSLRELADKTFDVLVVGAGIHGAAAAWTAARLKMRTALVDAGDFGGGASAASLKVIHGGLRYLQHGNLPRMRESIAARRLFLGLAPHLVRPQAFLVPTFGGGLRSRALMRVAMALNDAVGMDRNAGLDPAHQLPSGRLMPQAEAQRILAGAAIPGLTGGAVWHDALAENTERLTLSVALSAQRAGAAVANYARARRLLRRGDRVEGVELEDVLDGEVIPVRARLVINAAGPWLDQPWTGLAREPHALVGAWNVVVRKRWFEAFGVGLESVREHRDAEALVARGTRNLFFVPWRDGTMIGTVYEPFAGDPGTYRPSAESVAAFLEEVNTVYPPARLTSSDITFLQVGVQPAGRGGGSVEPDKHSEVIEEARRGGPAGLLSIKGVKFTTGLGVGRWAARLAARCLGLMDAPPDDAALYGGERLVNAAQARAWARAGGLSLDELEAQRLATQYGTRAEAVLELARADQAGRLAGAPHALNAEVAHAVRNERAVRLADVILRRTDLGSFARPPAATVTAVCDIMAAELGWSPARAQEERQILERSYAGVSA